MIGFAMLGSDDLARSRAFYDALMPLVGASLKREWSTDERIWYAAGPHDPMLAVSKAYDGRPARPGNGAMVALAVPSRDAVAAVHARALAAGGADEGGPGFRSDHPDDLYRAYFRDPDGNKLMVYARPRGPD